MTEADLQKIIRTSYSNTAKYVVENCYIFRDDWESDVIVVQKSSGYIYEIEIKVSISDFRADLKKADKHLTVSTGKSSVVKYAECSNLTTRRRDWPPESRYQDLIEWKSRPNRFFYAVPESLGLTAKDVPDYAGLITINGNIKTVKNAPLLHKEVVDYEKKLCNKFYYYWRDRNLWAEKLKTQNDRLRKIMEDNNIKVPEYL